MDDALLVGGVQTIGNLDADLKETLDRQIEQPLLLNAYREISP